MELLIARVILVAAMLPLIAGQTSKKLAKKATDQSKDIQQNMYSILRTMALPDATVKEGEPVSERFVLQVPGKLLNPDDYDPTNSSQDATMRKYTSFIPPTIEENMFRLSDIVPVANPLQGGETGESFMDMYETVISQLDVRGFDQKTQTDRARYEKALSYLSQSIPDPQNLTRNATRLDLYSRFQSKYNEARLKMEDEIKKNKDKNENNPIEYQTWFQTHYPSLNSEVENAYTEWLVFGEKDLIELYKAHLDVESQGVALEEARMALRSSGKVSLDRSSTVYPVYFEPSNWYSYLRGKEQPLSRQQIQVKISDIEARLATLESMKGTGASKEAEDFINKLDSSQEKAKQKLDQETKDLDAKKLACMKANEEKSKDAKTICQEYNNAMATITTLSTQYANKKSKVDYAKLQLRADDESKKSIDTVINTLEIQKKQLQSQLENAPSEIPDIPKGSGENDTQDLMSGWMEFEFDSVSSSKQVDKSSKSYSASMSFSAGGVGWGVSGGASYSKSEQKFAQKLSQSDIKISAKILKVSIKRPWFKASLFKSNQYIMSYNQKVSPGPMSETALVKILQSRTKTYIMPQYVNAFLLAKDVRLEFRGVDSSVKSKAVQQSASAHMSGHYGPFSASASFSYGSSNSHMQAESTADGLLIKIPGAQIIGYYVTVVPCFPVDKECAKT